MTNLTVKEQLYLESVDVLLQLVNKAKEFGYNFKYEEMAKITNVPLNRKINLIKGTDYITTTSLNEMYLNNDEMFKQQIERYLKS